MCQEIYQHKERTAVASLLPWPWSSPVCFQHGYHHTVQSMDISGGQRLLLFCAAVLQMVYGFLWKNISVRCVSVRLFLLKQNWGRGSRSCLITFDFHWQRAWDSAVSILTQDSAHEMQSVGDSGAAVHSIFWAKWDQPGRLALVAQHSSWWWCFLRLVLFL